MKNLAQVVEHLALMDISFLATHAAPGGYKTIGLSPEDVVQYADDPVGFLSKYYEVSRSQYIGWQQDEHSVMCAAKTKRGTRCKMTVPGGIDVSPQRWIELQGSFCHVHE